MLHQLHPRLSIWVADIWSSYARIIHFENPVEISMNWIMLQEVKGAHHRDATWLQLSRIEILRHDFITMACGKVVPLRPGELEKILALIERSVYELK